MLGHEWIVRAVLSAGGALLGVWLILIAILLVKRPEKSALKEAVRLLPDVLRLLKRLATDRTLPRRLQIRLWLMFVYLAMPIDLIPDFIPVIGHADDAILVCLVLRSVVRRAGGDAVRRHWPGTPQGLSLLWRAAGLPGTAKDPPTDEELPIKVS